MNPYVNDYRSYIELSLAVELYNVCRGKQFEPMIDGDFIHFINLRPTLLPVRTRNGEKTRLSYLIHILSREVVDSFYSEHWKNKMLEQCGIERPHYEKHRCDVLSKDTKGNKIFRESLQKAIKTAVNFDLSL